MSSVIPPPVNDDRQIVALRFAAQSSQRTSSTLSENHWLIYIKVAEAGNSTVRMNMRAKQPDDQEGMLEWTKQDYEQSNSELRHWEFKCEDMTVKSLAEMIYQNHYQFFIMSGGGSGCRHWVFTVAQLLHRNGNIKDDLSELWNGMQYRYNLSPSIAPAIQKWVQGTFLKPPLRQESGSFYVPTALAVRDDKSILFFVGWNNSTTYIGLDYWYEEGEWLVYRSRQAVLYTDP